IRMKVCIDTAHIFASGVDIRKKEAVDIFVEKLEKYDLLGKIACIHLNDSKTMLGSYSDRHENLGEGHIGLEGLKLFVTHPAFANVPLILETHGINKEGPNKENIDRAKALSSKIL